MGDGASLGFKRYYDPSGRRLVYVGAAADTSFWDEQWGEDRLRQRIEWGSRSWGNTRMVVRRTKEFLPRGARILEGGCGLGDKVLALQRKGYDVHGVDFAPSTVEAITRAFPDLKVSLGDVRSLEFEDGYFDGYWSLGVIEHFFDGYHQIAREMHRVIRPGGVLFLLVPSMSWIRQAKAKVGLFPRFTEDPSVVGKFYQFALNPKQVIKDFQDIGFQLIRTEKHNGRKGFVDELGLSRTPFRHGARFLPEPLVAPWAHHGMRFFFNRT